MVKIYSKAKMDLSMEGPIQLHQSKLEKDMMAMLCFARSHKI